MKKKLQKISALSLGAIPVCAAFMLSGIINSTGCWINGQDEMPEGAKKYRKF